MSTPPSWTCRPYRQGDEAALSELYELCFDKPLTVERWQWRFGNDEEPVDNVWVAVDADDQPICHYGGMLRRARVGGRDLRVMVSCVGMTAPGFRRLGVYKAVVEHAHDHWRASGFDLVVGMPNENHGSLIDTLGWQEVGRLRWLVRPLRPDLLLRRRTWLGRLPGVGLASRVFNAYWNRGGTPTGFVVTEVPDGDARATFAALPPDEAPERFTMCRDARWLAHRLLDAPEQEHRVVAAAADDETLGFSAFRLEDLGDRYIGAIVELMGDDSRVLDSLVRETAVRLGDAGAETIIALAVPDSLQHRALAQRGFRRHWGEFTVRAVLLNESLDVGALRAAAPWVLSGGDFDVV